MKNTIQDCDKTKRQAGASARESLLMGIRALGLALCVLPVTGTRARAQTHDAMEVQEARDNYIKETTKQRSYTREWDLSDLPSYSPKAKVSGTIRIWGLNYIFDDGTIQGWEQGFRKYHPDVKFEYNLPTALIAVPGLVAGQADLGASRPITFDERLLFQRIFRHDPLEIMMLTGSYDRSGWSNALAIVVNKDNPISKLTFAQLDGILGAERDGGHIGTTWHTEFARGADKNIRTWGELGLTGEWADKPINIHVVHLRFHHPRAIEEAVFKGGTKWNEKIHEYSNGAKADGSLYLTAPQIIDALSKDRYGLAYTNIRSLNKFTKALAISREEGGPYVPLTIENVQNRTYPLSNAEYWYLNREPGQPIDPKVKEYLAYTLSKEGQEVVAHGGMFLPLTAQAVREQLLKLE